VIPGALSWWCSALPRQTLAAVGRRVAEGNPSAVLELDMMMTFLFSVGFAGVSAE
jgi:hypothetical protein